MGELEERINITASVRLGNPREQTRLLLRHHLLPQPHGLEDFAGRTAPPQLGVRVPEAGRSLPATPEYATCSHAVETPIEALGSRTENERGDDPPGSGSDEDGQQRRQVDERQREGCSDEGPPERHSGSD